MFNIGIIGCGKISQVRHIPEYAQNPDARLAGFFDLNKERAQELAVRYGGKAFDSYEELLADREIDAVSVCVANNVHAEITVAALKAGKHVPVSYTHLPMIFSCWQVLPTVRTILFLI